MTPTASSSCTRIATTLTDQNRNTPSGRTEVEGKPMSDNIITAATVHLDVDAGLRIGQTLVAARHAPWLRLM